MELYAERGGNAQCARRNNMTNLLQETREAMDKVGLGEADIVFIGSEESGHQCTWEEFCALADFEYDEGFGQEVARDLIIVFKAGERLYRGEYDGSDWWGFSRPFQTPLVKHPILTLHGDWWSDLAELHKRLAERSKE